MNHPVVAATLPPALPRPALRIAYAVVVPFMLGALLVWLVRPDARPYASQALSVYAGTVVALLGGVHWGLAMRHASPAPARFAWGLASVGAASVAVMMPPDAGLVLHGAMLAGCYLVDRKVYPRESLAHWLTLRFRLSAIASLSCFLGAAGA
ncbi:MAG TPA: DUF3429 domain-containing protein [Burkholderiaceae bacterium]|nr:DUF3429 domain-containing protein [Burkholderiaceae bacterium]